MKYATNTLAALIALSSLAALGGCARPDAAGPQQATGPTVTDANPVFADVRFRDIANAEYDAVERATVMDLSYDQRQTVHGQTLSLNSMSVAHGTLPVPSYVEITELQAGRTILVRVADHVAGGAQSGIRLTPAAAAHLGIPQGAAHGIPLRVRRVSPPEGERAALRNGMAVAERLPTPESLLAVLRAKAAALPAHVAVVPTGAASDAQASTPEATAAVETGPIIGPETPAPTAEPANSDRFIVEAAGAPTVHASAPQPASATARGYFVQIGAFRDKAGAEAVARQHGAHVTSLGGLWRVRTGPYATSSAAAAAQARLRANGVPDAHIIRPR